MFPSARRARRSSSCAATRSSSPAPRRANRRVPVLLGSGVTPENVAEFYDAADGFIIGTYFKEGGLWSNTVEAARVERMVEAVRGLRALRAGERAEDRGA